MKMIKAWLFAAIAMCAASTTFGSEVLLGPGDVVHISVYGSPDLTLDTRVSDDNKITYPLIGTVDVKDMSTAQAETRIANMLERGGFIKHPQVNILVTSFQSRQVSVIGNVNRPGRYPLDGKRSLVDVLALAGGVSAEGGDMISVLRQRNGSLVREMIDLTEIMHSANSDKNVELSGGDVVYVERASRFYIYGEVQRPGVYRLEREMTVVQALSTGGGLNSRGTERGIQIRRRNADGKIRVLTPRLDDRIELDDVVYVKESLF